MHGKVAIGIGIVAAAATGTWALGPAELGLKGSPSDTYITVEKDRSWLGYLPAETKGVDLEIGSLNKDSDGTVSGRRVDLLEKIHSSSIGLCFARSAADVQAICPGAKPLGRMTRNVDDPWVGQLGTSPVDFLALLNLPAPTLRSADSIKS